MNKKANYVLETITVLFVLFGFILIVVFGGKLIDDINVEFQASDTLSTETKEIVQSATDSYNPLFDTLFMVALILLWLAALIGAFFIDVHPAIFFISVGLLLVFVIITAIFGNAFEDIINSPQLEGEAAKYPMSIWIMSNILIIGLLMVFTVGIVGFAKVRGGE